MSSETNPIELSSKKESERLSTPKFHVPLAGVKTARTIAFVGKSVKIEGAKIRGIIDVQRVSSGICLASLGNSLHRDG